MIHDTQLAPLLLIVLLAIGSWQRNLGPRLRWPPHVRRAFWPALDKVFGDGGLTDRYIGSSRAFVRDKTHDTDEYICSVDCSHVTLLVAVFKHGGYRWNLVATLKFVVTNPGRVYEVFSIAYRETLRAKTMHHVYGLPAREPGYNLHLGGHDEINYLHDPLGHTEGEQADGDPDHRFRDALDAAGIEYAELDDPLYA